MKRALQSRQSGVKLYLVIMTIEVFMSTLMSAFEPANVSLNKSGISKDILKTIIAEAGITPGINMALFIAAGSLALKKTWTGSDYGEHWLRVAAIGLGDTVSDDEKIVGILHDVVEDSDWEIEDLQEMGFSAKICEGVRSVTKNDEEKYLDATRRASINPIGRRVKMRDNKDNMDLTRSRFVATDKQKYLYHISYTYLQAVEKDEIPPNYSMWLFLQDQRYKRMVTPENLSIVAKAISEPMPDNMLSLMQKNAEPLKTPTV
jgi:hypothetical protein